LHCSAVELSRGILALSAVELTNQHPLKGSWAHPLNNLPCMSLLCCVTRGVRKEGPLSRCHCETQLQGSPAVEAANDRFSATMTNVVRWGDAAAPAAAPQRQLRSDTEIQARAAFVKGCVGSHRRLGCNMFRCAATPLSAAKLESRLR